MVTRFKRIPQNSVMCTVQGCGEVAAFFVTATNSGANSRPAPAAYCSAHAADAAKRLNQPWPISERKSAEPAARNAGSLVS
jgi:hypothetical protein